MEGKKQKVLLVVNPCAGKTSTRASVPDIISNFPEEEYEFTVRNTTCQGDATNIVKEEADKHDIVVCCGGDGTFNETMNGVMDLARRLPIGYIPSGSTNDFANTLGIPTKVKDACELIKSGNLNDYDIGLFNNRYFSYVASFGAFTRASYATNQKLKNIFGHAAYFPAAIPDAFNIKKYRLRIEHDGGIIEDEFVFGSISNSTSVGGFFSFKTDELRLNDGVFELLLCKNITFKSVIPSLYKVRHYQYDGNPLIFFRTKKLKITALQEEPVDWTLDGEYGGAHKEVMVHVLERAINIYSTDNKLFIKHEIPEVAPAVENNNETEESKEKKFFRKFKTQKAETAEAEESSEAESSEKDETTV